MLAGLTGINSLSCCSRSNAEDFPKSSTDSKKRAPSTNGSGGGRKPILSRNVPGMPFDDEFSIYRKRTVKKSPLIGVEIQNYDADEDDRAVCSDVSDDDEELALCFEEDEHSRSEDTDVALDAPPLSVRSDGVAPVLWKGGACSGVHASSAKNSGHTLAVCCDQLAPGSGVSLFALFAPHGVNGLPAAGFVRDWMLTILRARVAHLSANPVSTVQTVFKEVQSLLLQEELDLSASGCSVALLLAIDDQMLVVWLGDVQAISARRCFHGLEPISLNRPHTMSDEYERLRIETAGGGADGMVCKLAGDALYVTRAFGFESAIEFGLNSDPSVSSFQATSADSFYLLLASDIVSAIPLSSVIKMVSTHGYQEGVDKIVNDSAHCVAPNSYATAVVVTTTAAAHKTPRSEPLSARPLDSVSASHSSKLVTAELAEALLTSSASVFQILLLNTDAEAISAVQEISDTQNASQLITSMPGLFDILKNGTNQESRATAAVSLFDICSEPSVELSSQEGVLLILFVLDLISIPRVECQVLGATTICNLCARNVRNRTIFGDRFVLEKLATLMRSDSSDVLSAVCAAVCNVVVSNESNKKLLSRSAGFVASLIRLLVVDLPDVHPFACAAVWSLAFRDQYFKLLLVEEGVLRPLATILRSSTSAFTQLQALGALTAVTHGVETTRKQLVKLGLIPFLVTLFRQSDTALHIATLELLVSLLGQEDIPEFVRAGGKHQVKVLAKNGNTQVAKTAQTFLRDVFHEVIR